MVPIGNTSTSVGAVVKWEREREKWWFSWGVRCKRKGTHIEVETRSRISGQRWWSGGWEEVQQVQWCGAFPGRKTETWIRMWTLR